jgi:hypothetical protein
MVRHRPGRDRATRSRSEVKLKNLQGPVEEAPLLPARGSLHCFFGDAGAIGRLTDGKSNASK